MCDAPDYEAPAPAPAPPPTLEQIAPKSAASTTNEQSRKRMGLSRYKIDTSASSTTNKLGGVPKKSGV